MLPQYAVLPRAATHVDRRRRVSGAAVVEEGYSPTSRLLGQEQQSAVPQRWCGSDIRHTSGSTPGHAQWKHAHSQGLGYGGLH
jgi:hypothetical protein